jgi:Cu-Zn family superoxide dismutase
MRMSIVTFVLALCSSVAATPSMAAEAGAGAAPAAPTSAVALVQGTGDNKVSGTVRFTQSDGKIVVVADLQGLTPGKHGFHIHEFGDATSKDGSSAGGHFNPMGASHGGHDAAHHHAGDLGNIEAGADGKAHLELTLDDITLTDGPTAIVGRSVVVHAKEDDLTSQPAGNAGARIGVGVIGLAK